MPHSSNAHHDSIDGLAISLTNHQGVHAVDERQLIEAARCVLQDSALRSANVSLAVVDDATIHQLNRRYLGHDWPTDVLSFVLEEQEGHLEGEVVLSADTAAKAAAEHGQTAAAEQLLYVIHGTLHLVGYRDRTPAQRRRMRTAENRYLRRFQEEPACASEPELCQSGGTTAP